MVSVCEKRVHVHVEHVIICRPAVICRPTPRVGSQGCRQPTISTHGFAATPRVSRGVAPTPRPLTRGFVANPRVTRGVAANPRVEVVGWRQPRDITRGVGATPPPTLCPFTTIYLRHHVPCVLALLSTCATMHHVNLRDHAPRCVVASPYTTMYHVYLHHHAPTCATMHHHVPCALTPPCIVCYSGYLHWGRTLVLSG